MKIVSFNVNGIRARFHQLQAICESLNPDILGLQETKVQDHEFPWDFAKSLGYHAYIYGQKAYHGVAFFSKQPLTNIKMGLPGMLPDDQKRIIIGEATIANGKTLMIINGYFPQGDNRNHPVKFLHKQQFYTQLTDYLKTAYTPEQPLLLLGDMNVAPADMDVGIGNQNIARWLQSGACGFLPEERDWLQTLTNWGLVDLFRARYPQTVDSFSWFDYRSRGFEDKPRRGLRLDLMLATAPVVKCCKDAGIDYAIRSMERPSDHCPVWVELKL